MKTIILTVFVVYQSILLATPARVLISETRVSENDGVNYAQRIVSKICVYNVTNRQPNPENPAKHCTEVFKSDWEYKTRSRLFKRILVTDKILAKAKKNFQSKYCDAWWKTNRYCHQVDTSAPSIILTIELQAKAIRSGKIKTVADTSLWLETVRTDQKGNQFSTSNAVISNNNNKKHKMSVNGVIETISHFILTAQTKVKFHK